MQVDNTVMAVYFLGYDYMKKQTITNRSKIMRSIHSSDTKAEIILRKNLWKAGVRYRKNYKKLPGTPDIALTKYKIAIFVDGDFWHAHNIDKLLGRIKTNKDFWTHKLKRNSERDIDVNDSLLDIGWIVLRFWESDIKNNLQNCLKEISEYLPLDIRVKLNTH